MALRIKGKGSVFQDVPVTGALSAALLEWKDIQEGFKGRRIMAPGGIAFAGSQFVFGRRRPCRAGVGVFLSYRAPSLPWWRL